MIDQINFIAQGWFSWMYSMFWQVSLLILIISAIDLLIKKWAWPQVRYVLWTLILLKLVLPPSWTFSGSIIPNIRSEIDTEVILFNNAAQSEEAIAQGEEKLLSPVNTENSSEQATPIITENVNKSEPITAALNWKAYLMGVWILGILVFGIVLGARIAKLKKWHREQEEKKNIPEWFHEVLVKVGKILSVERLPSIVFSNEAVSPAVYGIFRPVLLLPENYIKDLTKDEAEHVLLHELAHIKRGDLIVHGICLILQIFYWFNPFLIWSRKQMKHIREICCDMTIANILREKTKQYKETLINTARELLTENTEPAMGLLGLFEEPFQLIARLKWLNKESWKDRQLAYATALVSALLFTAFVLPMGEMEYSFSSPAIETKIWSGEEKSYLERINLLNEEINEAFADWDFEAIEKFYTEDAILDEVQHPTVKGIKNIMNYVRKQEADGIDFIEMKNFIVDFWKDGNNLHSVETFTFKMSLEVPEVTLAGTGSMFVIWEIQDDDEIKVKYSIINLDEAIPQMVDKGGR